MSRNMAILAELDVLTSRLRDGTAAYARRVEWLVDNWRDAARLAHESRAPRPRTSGAPDRRTHYPGAAAGGGCRP